MNHAISMSNDGGSTWGVATPVLAARGPTCQGSIARLDDGRLLLSNPNYAHWRYPADRKNMTVFRFHKLSMQDANSSALGQPDGEVQIFAGPSAYSGMSRDGRYIMFEGGEKYRYASVMFSSVEFQDNGII